MPATAAPHGLACLMMATAVLLRAGVTGQLVHQAPGGVAVEEVEVGELLPAVLHHGVPPTRRAGDAVARAALVRVLPVAEHLGALEGEVQRRREHRAQCGLLGVGGRGAVEIRDRGRAAGVEPGDDGRVVGGRVRERGTSEAAPRRRRQRARGAQLLEHDGVVRRRRDDPDVVVVLGRGAHHGRAADVDQLNGGIGRERVQVRHDEVDGLDVVRRQVVEVFGLGAVGEDPAVDLGVERLDAPAEHLGRAGHLRHLEMRDPGLGQLGRGVAAGDQLPTEVRETLRQVDQPLLVVDGQQGSHDVISGSAPSLSVPTLRSPSGDDGPPPAPTACRAGPRDVAPGFQLGQRPGDGGRVEGALGHLDPLVQRRLGVARQHRHDLLSQDRSGVQLHA